jgi:ribonuclease VapC
MIAVDASAVVAVIAKEPPLDRLSRAILVDADRRISPVSYVEVVMALARTMQDAKLQADAYLSGANIVIEPIGSEQSEWAARAFFLYGKGRHPARLNLGDCFSYALAKAFDAPLLFIGDDFTKTDIRAA